MSSGRHAGCPHIWGLVRPRSPICGRIFVRAIPAVADANRERIERLLAAIPERQDEAVAKVHEHMDAIWQAALKQRNEG